MRAEIPENEVVVGAISREFVLFGDERLGEGSGVLANLRRVRLVLRSHHLYSDAHALGQIRRE